MLYDEILVGKFSRQFSKFLDFFSDKNLNVKKIEKKNFRHQK